MRGIALAIAASPGIAFGYAGKEVVNVDDLSALKRLFDALTSISATVPVIFPVHPRTRQKISELGLSHSENLQLWEPQSYLQFLALQQKASVVITDSGGIQEETTFLRVPCLTLRDTTERPVTVTVGTNVMIGRDMDLLGREVKAVLNGERSGGTVIYRLFGMAGPQRGLHGSSKRQDRCCGS